MCYLIMYGHCSRENQGRGGREKAREAGRAVSPAAVARGLVLPRKLRPVGVRPSLRPVPGPAPSACPTLAPTMASVSELACTSLALILHDDEVDDEVMVMEGKINSIIRTAGVNVEPFGQVVCKGSGQCQPWERHLQGKGTCPSRRSRPR